MYYYEALLSLITCISLRTLGANKVNKHASILILLKLSDRLPFN